MNYPVFLSLCLFFFVACGIHDDDQNADTDDIPVENQNEEPYSIQNDGQNEEPDGITVKNQNEESCAIQGEDHNEKQLCSVCYDKNPDTSIGECSHKFCKGCIDTWKINKRSYRCPLCNQVYDNLDVQEDNNTASLDTMIDLLVAMRNITMTFDNTEDNFQVTNNNTTSVHTDDDRIPQETSVFNIQEEVLNDSEIPDIVINYFDDFLAILRSINMTSNNTDDNTTSQETRLQDFFEDPYYSIDMFAAMRYMYTTSDDIDNNVTSDSTDDNTTPIETNNTTPQDISED
ncbi:uncharacterized protein LOC126907322 isoform X3 [Daktulosphaira vitifoliae]|uniref:uncharacterized protein LOC126907322 isoform X3 n=1 Tax=Daktulosphaira vitifoliae TaxID=58002 RepID=UPI0021AA3354|nr:uncharacterized protein LOC126907322 isoform X3 [Daktulosphaira vitifoliae]